jgi:hypothetical protein
MWLAAAYGLVGGCAVEPPENAAEQHIGNRIRLPGTTVDLETVGVARGTTTLDLGVIGSSTPSTGTTVTVHTGFSETLQTTTSGLEQSWSFGQAPSGSGDLVVTVSASGLSFVSSDSAGLHFQQADKANVRYSHGTWIDGTGHTTSIPATYSGGQIELRVPAAALTTFPAVLDPEIAITPINVRP